MTTNWNPNAPNVVGPEFMGTLGRWRDVDGLFEATQRFHSASAETINNARVHVLPSVIGDQQHIVEINALGDLYADPANIAQVRYVPNAVANVVGTVVNEAGSTVNRQNSVDDGDTLNTADWLDISAASNLDFEFSSAGYTTHGRILDVSFFVTQLLPLLYSDAQRRYQLMLHNGGTYYGAITKVVPILNTDYSGGRAWFSFGEINPITNKPWTTADIQAFDSGVTRLFVTRIDTLSIARLGNLQMVVTYETTERRVASGVFAFNGTYTDGTLAQQWTLDIPLVKPDGTSGWAKASATDYYLSVRKANVGDRGTAGQGSFRVIENIPGDTTIPNDLDGTDWIIKGGVQAGSFFYPSAPINFCYYPFEAFAYSASVGRALLAFALIRSDTAISTDSQPYRNVTQQEVYSTTSGNQGEFTPTASGSFGRIRCVVGHNGNPPTQELVLQVRRRSDSVVMGTCRVQPEVAVYWPYSYVGATTAAVVVEAEPDLPYNLTSGVQYYVDLTSQTGLTNPWLVGLLAVFPGYETPTYGGATDQVGPVDPTGRTGDFAFLIESAPATPTGFNALGQLAAIPDLGDGVCPLDGIPYALISWTPAIIGDFASYTLQRLGVDGSTWETIAVITDENVGQFTDYEARLTKPESYRLRLSRGDGASSNWTAIHTVTLPSAGCGLSFSSNEAPELAVAYPDTYTRDPIRSYSFPESAEIVERKLFFRDYQVVFRPLSRRGVKFSRALTISGLTAPAAGVGPPAADRIRDLAWAVLSYVCIRDDNGNRWYGNLNVTDLAVNGLDDAHWRHQVKIDVTETTGTPSQPDAATT